jgi:cytochrome oxidase assembly protein ShyY1
MLRLSYWQWERHLEKLEVISRMQSRLNDELIDINYLVANNKTDWQKLIYRRANLVGEYDFSSEVYIKNRTWNGFAGYFVVTPFKIFGSDKSILINRGFAPYSLIESSLNSLSKKQAKGELTVVFKRSNSGEWFAPDNKPLDLKSRKLFRIDIPKLAPLFEEHNLLPIYADYIGKTGVKKLIAETVVSGSDKDEMLSLISRASVKSNQDLPKTSFPVIAFDLLLSPGRHLGYVFEWIAMAFGTAIIGLILQFRRS